jgi:hypothetical protein
MAKIICLGLRYKAHESAPETLLIKTISLSGVKNTHIGRTEASKLFRARLKMELIDITIPN